MNDDYLWDGSGEPDPDIQRLETTLGKLRHNRPVPEFPEPAKLRRWFRLAVLLPRLAALATAVLVISGAWLALRHHQPVQPVQLDQPASSGWEIARLAGAPRVGANLLADSGRVAVGELVETDSASRARIRVDTIGQVEVEPNTRLRMVQARPTENRLALDHGEIHAFISAPPRLFFVDTPSAVAVDLGCAYTLQVDNQGVGLLRVTFGWVEFESGHRESLIPAGAAAVTRPGFGPGTPYFEDASDAFKAALAKLDFGDASPRAAALNVLLAEARRRDAFTLLNLFPQAAVAERGRIYDRLAALVPPPPGVTREQAVAGDGRVIGLWWDRMGVGHPLKK